MRCVLGIDIGSSAAKAGLFSPEGTALRMASRAYATEEPRAGHKEQDPECWWKAAVECIREVTANVAADEIAAVAAVGHISSCTFVDGDGRPLRHAITFQDLRGASEMGRLYGRFTRAELAALLDIDLPPAPTWLLPKLLWMERNEPATLARTRHLLQAKDFINFRLTGEFASDASSNRGLVDFRTNRPSEPVFRAFGLAPELVPRLIEPAASMGAVTARAAAETGLRQGLPVMAGWNDLNACVLGSAVVEPGQTFNISGTSEHVGTVVSAEQRVPELICAPFLDGKRLFYGVTTCGGGSLEWYRRTFGTPLEELIERAAQTPAGCEGLLFLPYLEGERAPIWDAQASGAFVGLRGRHGQGHFVRAILEGVAYSLRQILEIVERHAATGESVIVSGGPSGIGLWNQIKSDVLGRPLVRAGSAHAGVLGAAMLAAVGAGMYATAEEAARGMATLAERFAPEAAQRAMYGEMFARYTKLYPALRECLEGKKSESIEAYV